VLAPILVKVLVVVVALTIGTWLVYKVLRPIRLFDNEQRQKARIVAEYKSLRTQNDDLRRQLAYIKTSRGIAQAARKQGFVKPGEISLVIPERESNPPKPSR
jgi:cell division protein FtsB